MLTLSALQALWCHKTYAYGFADAPDAPPLGTLTVRCSVNLLEGGTGCALWDAGFALAELALSSPHDFAGRRVLELGAGAGGAAVALARAAPAWLAASDHDADALANLRANLRRNAVRLAEDERVEGDATSEDEGVRCIHLSWEARFLHLHCFLSHAHALLALLTWLYRQGMSREEAAALAPDIVVGGDLMCAVSKPSPFCDALSCSAPAVLALSNYISLCAQL